MATGKNSSPATNVLFVGGLPPTTTDDDLTSVLAPHGALDCVTARVPHGRSYAFALFRDVCAACAAISSAQGAKILDGSMRLEVARPAKAVRNLWVAGICSSVTESDLENEFSKFGKIEDLRFFRNRHSAMIDFFTLEDAISAHKSMNGRVLGDEHLCVDFQRSQVSKRDPVVNTSLNSRAWAPPEYSSDSHQRPKRNARDARKEGGTPSSVLWVGYPPNSKIDEQKLHNAMILFGEIERIKCFPLRKYAFVEFRSTDEAYRAKMGLEGRLFNDPKIRILFSHSRTKNDPLDDGLLPAPRGEFEERERRERGRSEFDFDERRERGRVDYDFEERERKRRRESYWEERERGLSFRERSYSPGFYRGYSPDEEGMRWRGPVLKGGSFVCNARCVSIGRGIDLPLLPQAINCSARTDLETLARHYHDSTGFNAVFFLPDSEADFASYTEFLQYLRIKNRAGVAKLSDGSTTLFLVPPSDFLTDILGIRGPERLYGIVLNLPQPASPPPVMNNTRPVMGKEGITLPPELINSLASIIPAITGGSNNTGGGSNVGFGSGGNNDRIVQGQGAQFPTNGGETGGYDVSGGSSASYMNQNPYQYEPAGPSQSSNYYMNTPTREPVSYQNPYEKMNVPYQPSMSYQPGMGYQPSVGYQPPSVGPVGTGTGTVSDQQDEDKNQRYQSTLQFAANLLQQIQQKQQQQQQRQ